MQSSVRPIVITTPEGLAPFVEDELAAAGFPVVWASENAVGTKGDFPAAMRLNLWLRCAHHVLYQVEEFPCRDLDTLYRSALALPWETVLPADGYFSVVSSVNNPSIRDHRIVNLKCKDAVVDRIASRKGRRPDSGSERDGAVVTVFWNGERCTISIDTSGEPLSKRGYRKIPLRAPMQETLAAGVVLATRLGAQEYFINPMCGSGTLAIEAAMIITGRAPGLTRENFGFMHTLLYDKAQWQHLCVDACSRCDVREQPVGRIIAGDNDPQVIAAARSNAAAAGVENIIEFVTGDFTETPIPGGDGVIVFNPEYGIRLGDEEQLVESYRAIGKFLKQRCQGYRGYVFTGNAKLAGNIGLKAGRKLRFQSGKIECKLYEYELFRGRKE